MESVFVSDVEANLSKVISLVQAKRHFVFHPHHVLICGGEQVLYEYRIFDKVSFSFK